MMELSVQPLLYESLRLRLFSSGSRAGPGPAQPATGPPLDGNSSHSVRGPLQDAEVGSGVSAANGFPGCSLARMPRDGARFRRSSTTQGRQQREWSLGPERPSAGRTGSPSLGAHCEGASGENGAKRSGTGTRSRREPDRPAIAAVAVGRGPRNRGAVAH